MAQLLLASSSLTAVVPATLAVALARVEARLDAWAANTTAYNNLVLQVFAGAGTEPALWQQAAAELQAALQSTLQSSGLAISLELLSPEELPGMYGAYIASAPGGGERIVLNAGWLQTASASQIEAVLLEELGHAIDTRLNGSADSPGDEGERFSALLRGLTPNPDAASDNDQFQITLQGQPLLVEASADTTAPRVDLSGFRNPGFAGSASAFGLPTVGLFASPELADIDGDGDLDAFIGNGSGNTLFFRNTGSATAPAFAASSNAFGLFAVGGSASPSFVDIDGDGDLDAFIGNNAGSTLFFRNTGNSTAPAFAGSATAFGLPDVGTAAIPTFADSDGDGDLDAFIGNNAGSTLFFRNTGSATAPAFAGSASAFGLPAVGTFASPAFGDSDGDGDLDAFIGNNAGNTFFFRNTAAPGATTPAFAGSTSAFGLAGVGVFANPAFADIDGDGDLDAFIGNNLGNTFFFRNTGGGGLSSTNPNGTYGPGSVITIEVPFSETVFVVTTGGTPSLRLETGSTDRFATFTGGSGTRVLTFSYTVQAGDASGDLDLTSSSALLLNGATIRDAAGNDAVLTLTTPGSTGSLSANADLVINGGPPPDTTAPRLDLSGFRNPAFAGSASAFGLPDVGLFASPDFADIDGDGDLDAFIGNIYGSTLFFRNTGSATAPAFAGSATPFGLFNGGGAASPSFVDIDGDGDLDAFIGNGSGNTLFFRNTGSATAPAFAGSATPFGLFNGGGAASPSFVDIDGDGDLDAFIGERFGNTLFFRNTAAPGSSAPAFAAPTTNPFGLEDVDDFASPAFADIDGDGDLDAFIGNFNGGTRFFPNTGSATVPAFARSASAIRLPAGILSASPAFVDIDGDGDLDAFIGIGTGSTLFFLNTGSGGLSSTNPNGIYGPGSVITIEVPFSEPVFVDTTNASPTLRLETGSTDRFATFTGGSGTRVLTFSYTVQATDTSADLDLTSSSALALNGATIRDAAGNNAVLTLPAPGNSGSLGANAALVIDGGPAPDTIAPSLNLSGFRNPAFAGSASAFGLPDLGESASPAFADIDRDGDLDAFIGNSDGNTLFFRNTGSATAPAFAGPVSAFGLPAVGFSASPSFVDIDSDGDLDAFIGDSDGNTLFFRNTGNTAAPAFAASASAFGLTDVGFFASPSLVDIDNDGDLDAFIGNRAGKTLFFRNTGNATAPAFAGSASAFGLTDVGFSASPTFADSDGDGDLDAFIGNNLGNILFFRNTAAPGATAPSFAGSASSFGLPDGDDNANPAFVDIDGDGDLDAFIGSYAGTTLFFRNTASGGLSSNNPSGIYGQGSVITIEVPFSEPVFVTGTPSLRLETGSTDRLAIFSGGSGTRVLSFAYTVQAGDTTPDLDLLSVGALILNGGTIRDATGNNAVLTLPAPGTTGSLSAIANLVIDGIAPLLTAGPTAATAPGVSGFSLTANEAVTAALRKADNSLLFSTPLAANTSALLTVSAQAAITATSLIVTDSAGNRTTSATSVLLGTNNADALTGSGNADVIFGFGGNDILTGAAGIDVLIGGDGSDTYNIETNGDLVIETNAIAATGGIDTVRSSLATITLTDNVENLILTGGGVINGTGNILNNRITGNSAANILTGAAGIDTLIGGDGSDTYNIETSGDLVIETNAIAATGGIDTVRTSLLDYTLTDNVENLILTGGGGINGTGNILNNRLTGNSAANILSGAAGNDTLVGGAGNDTLSGGSGNDTLTGGLNADTFRFDSALNAATNRDLITDFSPLAQGDRIELENSVFTTLTTTGTLDPTAFFSGASATTAAHRILYNTATGLLAYDADGTGAAAAIAFATISPSLAISNASFNVT